MKKILSIIIVTFSLLVATKASSVFVDDPTYHHENNGHHGHHWSDPTCVPEPSTIALFGTAAIIFVYAKTRKKV